MSTVIKVGSSSLHDGISPISETFDDIASQVVSERQAGNHLAIVSSGAIQFGRVALGIKQLNGNMPKKQVMSTVGQPLLMAEWQRAFEQHDIMVGQVLATNLELKAMPEESLVLKNVIEQAFDMSVVPIINENDALSSDEIEKGDNDRLAARVAYLLGANQLYLLGQEDGLYEDFGTPKQRLISTLNRDHFDKAKMYCVGTQDGIGTGGMSTKIDAAKFFVHDEHVMYIANAGNPMALAEAQDGLTGTMFVA